MDELSGGVERYVWCVGVRVGGLCEGLWLWGVWVCGCVGVCGCGSVGVLVCVLVCVCESVCVSLRESL